MSTQPVAPKFLTTFTDSAFQAQVRQLPSAKDGVLIIDPATRKILDANPFMSELLGYTRDELLGKELFEIGLLKDEEASRAGKTNRRGRGRIGHRHHEVGFDGVLAR